jgi:hypothetical protein
MKLNALRTTGSSAGREGSDARRALPGRIEGERRQPELAPALSSTAIRIVTLGTGRRRRRSG